LIDLAINYTDMTLKRLIKSFVDNTAYDEKKLYTTLSEYDAGVLFESLKGLRIQNV
jgi:hypothetical protein